ncbi:Deoxyribose-phosphate aldolase [Streptomyces violaceorubidus]
MKLADVREAVAAGADEVDMVIDRGAFLAGQLPEGVRRDHRRAGGLRNGARLKVIFETGELSTYDNIRRASWLGMLAGADFIKTSTGKVAVNATPANTLLMLEAVRDFRAQTGVQVGVKPAGGIRTVEGRDQVPGPGQRDGGRGLAGQPLVPLRRLLAAERPAAAAPEAGHRPLLRPRLRDGGLITMAPAPAPASAFAYAPAPESRAVVDIAPSYGLFIDGEFTEAAGGKVFKTVSPATEEVLSEVAEAGRGGRRAARCGRPAGPSRSWSALPGAERAKYLFRIARIIQERSRELAVLETLDNGKPIRETRDADLPLVAAHFFYYAGWADKLDHAGYGAAPRPLGVAGQVIPWNFPLLMAGLEARPCPGRRTTRWS